LWPLCLCGSTPSSARVVCHTCVNMNCVSATENLDHRDTEFAEDEFGDREPGRDETKTNERTCCPQISQIYADLENPSAQQPAQFCADIGRAHEGFADEHGADAGLFQALDV